MKPIDFKNFDFNNIPIDENSEEIEREILLLKSQGLTNNIDFEQADIEEKLVQEKLREKERKLNNDNTNILEENIELNK